MIGQFYYKNNYLFEIDFMKIKGSYIDKHGEFEIGLIKH